MNLHVPKTANVLGFFLYLTFYNFLFASDIINLKILNLWDNSPLKSVKITVDNRIVFSDSIGTASIVIDKTGPVYIKISLDGYYPEELKISSHQNEQIIYLQPIEETSGIQIQASNIPQTRIDLEGPSNIIRVSPLHMTSAENISYMIDNSAGIYVKDYGAGNALKTISIRGLGAEQTAISYDGINLNSKQLGLTELNSLDVQNLNYIEIFRGGNSSLFGSGAITGAVNFVPSLPDDAFHYRISNTYDSKKSIQNTLMSNFSLFGINHRMYVNRINGKNDFPFRFNNKKYYRKNNDQSLLQYGYTLYNKSSEILMEVMGTSNEQGIPNQILDRVNEEDFARQKDGSILTRIKWKPLMQSEMQIYWMYHKNIYKDPTLLFNNTPLHSTHINNVYGLQFSKGLIIKDYIRTFTKIEFDYSTLNSTDAGKREQIHSSLSSICEASILQVHDFDLSLGTSFRFENYWNSDHIILPKIGATFSNKEFKIYSSIGLNFRSPTFNERYWKPGGNPDLNSEKSRNIEGGIAYKDFLFGDFTINIDFYNNQVNNMIRWVPDNQSNLWSPENISSVKTEGIEFGLNYAILKDYLNINGNYSINRTVKTKPEYVGDNTVNNQVPFVPREMANLLLNSKATNWAVYFNLSYTGFRYLSYSNSADDFLPSFTTLNSGINYNFESFEQYFLINLEINNLTDLQYQIMNGYPMPGRSFKCSLIIYK